MKFLGNISVEIFLKDYWEKKPLLIKNAVEGICEFATSDDLKELSSDADFETRIVYNAKKNISVKHGPLKEADFKKEGWTLVCHNLNLINEQFDQLKNNLNFLPDWLFDDVMATHSPAESTIGAHIDKYNVFILQGNGSRKWQLQTNPDPTYIEGIDVKILKKFHPEIEWILEPGDMIYIPSNVAHQGTSLTESISYSLGFKSLESEKILSQYLNDFMGNFESEVYLKDQTTKPVNDPFLFSESISKFFYEELQKNISSFDQFNNWMSSFLSTPKTEIKAGEVYIEEEIKELLKDNNLMKDVYTKVASQQKKDHFVVGINQQVYSLKDSTYQKVLTWFTGNLYSPIPVETKNLDNDEWTLLIDLIKNGTFYFEEKED